MPSETRKARVPLFDPDLVYPRDDYGVYTEIPGKVIGVDEPLGDQTPVKLWTEHGAYTVWAWSKYAPKVGFNAIARIYQDPGHDDTLTSWAAPVVPCQSCGAIKGVAYEDARTAYEVPEPTFWDKVRGEEPPDMPNQPIPLCRPCAEEHHRHWDAAWQEYRSGLL